MLQVLKTGFLYNDALNIYTLNMHKRISTAYFIEITFENKVITLICSTIR